MTTDINNNPIIHSLNAGDGKTHVNNSHLENPPEESKNSKVIKNEYNFSIILRKSFFFTLFLSGDQGWRG